MKYKLKKNYIANTRSNDDLMEMKTKQESYDSEKYFKTIFDASMDGIAVVNAEGKIEFANESYFKIIDWPRDEIIGQCFMKIIPDDSKEFVMKHWRNVQIDHGGIHELKIKSASGKIIYLNVSSSLVEINGMKVIVFIHDISEKKNHEIDLKESEKRYKDLFENANDPMYTHDLLGNFLSVNKLGIELLGGTEEEILGSNIIQWLTPVSYKAFQENARKIFLNQPFEPVVVIEVITRTGEHKFGEARIRLIREGEKIIAIHGIVRDITEKIELEKELRESEAKFRELFENANDGIYTHDLEGFFHTVNDAGCRILECSKDEIIGANISSFLTPQSLELSKNIINKYISGENVEQPILLELISKNKKQLFVEFRNRIIKDNGTIVAIHGIARDITEKKLLEQKLKEYNEKLEQSYNELKKSEEKYRDLFENAQDAMYVMDFEGNFLKMNQTGLSIIGCTKEEIIGSNISQWVTQESMKLIRERQKRRMAGEILDKIDVFEVVCKNGEHRWAEVKTRDIKEGEKAVEIHGIGRDITENMLLKQELNKSNKQHKLLCYLIQGTRGGKTRALLLKHLSEKSCNANQLAKAMNMDYKTIRHHLNVLVKNGIISKDNDGYSDLYFISKNIEMNLNMMSL